MGKRVREARKALGDRRRLAIVRKEYTYNGANVRSGHMLLTLFPGDRAEVIREGLLLSRTFGPNFYES